MMGQVLTIYDNNNESSDSQKHDSESYDNLDTESKINRFDEDKEAHSDDPDQVDDPVTQNRRPGIVP